MSAEGLACSAAAIKNLPIPEFTPSEHGEHPPHVLILGVPVSLIDMSAAVSNIIAWVSRATPRYVCVRDVHGLMRSVSDPEMMRIQHQAGMVTPDGMPLVWLSRLRTKCKTGRVCGADLVDALCEAGQNIGLRHFFYGGKSGVAEKMIENLKAKYPRLAVAGYSCPPFHLVTIEEDLALVDTIKAANAQIVWVGISTPKQEFWMRDHVGRIGGATLIGVGAAFDFHSGAIARAPVWMQKYGFEWLHRLAVEPRRLWRRYLLVIPWFGLRIVGEELTRRLAWLR